MAVRGSGSEWKKGISMRKNSIKNTRINGEVQKELSVIIQNEIKDPRIAPMTSVVAVEVAPDLKTCKAYISVLGNEEAAAEHTGRLKERRGIHSPSAGAYGKSSKHAGDPFYSGSVD